MPYAHFMLAEENLGWALGLQHPESPDLNQQGTSPRKAAWIWLCGVTFPDLIFLKALRGG